MLCWGYQILLLSKPPAFPFGKLAIFVQKGSWRTRQHRIEVLQADGWTVEVDKRLHGLDDDPDMSVPVLTGSACQMLAGANVVYLQDHASASSDLLKLTGPSLALNC